MTAPPSPPPPLATQAAVDEMKSEIDKKLDYLKQQSEKVDAQLLLLLQLQQAPSVELAKVIKDLPGTLKTAFEPLITAAKGTAANKDDIIAAAIEVLSGKIAQGIN